MTDLCDVADITPSLVRPPRPAPPRPSSHPPLAPSSLIALLPPLEAVQTVYHTPRKEVVVCAWPRANAIPNRSLAHFDARALLHKPFHAVE